MLYFLTFRKLATSYLDFTHTPVLLYKVCDGQLFFFPNQMQRIPHDIKSPPAVDAADTRRWALGPPIGQVPRGCHQNHMRFPNRPANFSNCEEWCMLRHRHPGVRGCGLAELPQSCPTAIFITMCCFLQAPYSAQRDACIVICWLLQVESAQRRSRRT